MHDLEERLGKDVMARAFKVYYQRWRFRHPSAADLREVLAEVSGDRRTVEDFFTQQVYGAAWIDDRVESLVCEEQLPLPGTVWRDGKWIELTRAAAARQIAQQRTAWNKTHPHAKPGDGGPFPFRTTVIVRRDGARYPASLSVKFADGSSETVHWDDASRWRRFSWVKPVKAVAAELDPARKLLLDGNKLNDSLTAQPNRAASRRWTSDLAAALQALYSLMEAL
jgi:hypothetical protein